VSKPVKSVYTLTADIHYGISQCSCKNFTTLCVHFPWPFHGFSMTFQDFPWSMLFSMTIQAWNLVFLNPMTFQAQWSPWLRPRCTNDDQAWTEFKFNPDVSSVTIFVASVQFSAKCTLNSVQVYVQRWTRFSWTEIWSSLVQPGLRCIRKSNKKLKNNN